MNRQTGGSGVVPPNGVTPTTTGGHAKRSQPAQDPHPEARTDTARLCPRSALNLQVSGSSPGGVSGGTRTFSCDLAP